jgi:ankyrin repeat protein
VHHGAVVNVEDDDKRTPLFYAVQQGHVDTVARLMQLGADRNYRFSVSIGNRFDGNISATAVTILLQGPRWSHACRLLQPERDNGKGAGVVEAKAGERADAGRAPK